MSQSPVAGLVIIPSRALLRNVQTLLFQKLARQCGILQFRGGQNIPDKEAPAQHFTQNLARQQDANLT